MINSVYIIKPEPSLGEKQGEMKHGRSSRPISITRPAGPLGGSGLCPRSAPVQLPTGLLVLGSVQPEDLPSDASSQPRIQGGIARPVAYKPKA